MGYYKKITVLSGLSIVCLFLLTTAIIVMTHMLNVTPYVVEDNKMAPAYRKGGLLFVQQNDEQAVVGESITFYTNQGRTIKTLRVIAIDERIHGYVVKGDNVKQLEMGLVHFRNLIGRPAFYLPVIGFLLNTQFMHVVKIVLFFLAIFLTFLMVFYQKKYQVKCHRLLEEQVESQKEEFH